MNLTCTSLDPLCWHLLPRCQFFNLKKDVLVPLINPLTLLSLTSDNRMYFVINLLSNNNVTVTEPPSPCWTLVLQWGPCPVLRSSVQRGKVSSVFLVVRFKLKRNIDLCTLAICWWLWWSVNIWVRLKTGDLQRLPNTGGGAQVFLVVRFKLLTNIDVCMLAISWWLWCVCQYIITGHSECHLLTDGRLWGKVKCHFHFLPCCSPTLMLPFHLHNTNQTTQLAGRTKMKQPTAQPTKQFQQQKRNKHSFSKSAQTNTTTQHPQQKQIPPVPPKKDVQKYIG